ncbi:MAG TPA: hypothetical protein VFL77_03520 [Solirubrobacterales bacterium]|nr:hypothetical protein [Solirubrobacterales bacterium]
MTPQHDPEARFEERLLSRLKAVVAERGAAEAGSEAAPSGSAGPGRRRGSRLALAAVAALATAAAVLVFSSGGDNPSRAFAVERHAGGGVTIEVYSLEDASGLEEALEDAGIRAQVNWLPAGVTCREPHYTPSRVKLPGGGTVSGLEGGGPGALKISIGSTRSWRESFGKVRHGEISDREIANFNLDPAAFRPDQSVILFGSPVPFGGDPEGGFQARFQVAEGPVEPCDPLPAPAGSIGSIKVPEGARAGGAPAAAPPAPGQFLYAKTKEVQLQGWEPDGRGGGFEGRPRHFTANLLGPRSDARPALVPTIKEAWTAADGRTRVRETLGRVEFLSGEDQRRWEEAGSPPPFAYDPGEHDVSRDGSGRPVKEFASRSWRGGHVFSNLSKLSRLPTEPEALRLAIEGRGGESSPGAPSPAGSHVGGVTAERLLEILAEPITSPALRTAAFDALAELPGIALKRNVADVAGRRGEAITWVRERGFGRELIFDPSTAKVLAQVEMIFGPPSTGEYGVPAGTVFRETAYLRSAIVDSKHQRPH